MPLFRDQGVMDEDGYCSIVGRLKDVVIRGGENVYPTEIEQVLYHHPKVKDVQVGASVITRQAEPQPSKRYIFLNMSSLPSSWSCNWCG